MKILSKKHMLWMLAAVFSASCATTTVSNLEDYSPTETENAAHVVLKLDKGSHYVKKLVFRHIANNTDYELLLKRREGNTLVLPIPAGDYYLRRLDTNFEDKMSVHFPKPKHLLSMETGKVHYLGDLSWKDDKVFVNFSKEAVLQAMNENKALFDAATLVVYNHLFGHASIASVEPKNSPGGTAIPLGRSRSNSQSSR